MVVECAHSSGDLTFLCIVVHDKNLPVVRKKRDSSVLVQSATSCTTSGMTWNWTEDCILAALQRKNDLESWNKTKPRQISEPQRPASKRKEQQRWNWLASTVAGEPQERKGTSRPWNLWRPQAIVASLECCACPAPVSSGAPSPHPIQSTFQQPATWMHVMWWASRLTLLPNSDRGWLHQSPLTFSLGSMPISLPVTSC